MSEETLVPNGEERIEIADLVEHSSENIMSAEDIKNLKKNNPEILESFVEAHTITVGPLRVSLIFEEHEGGLFGHIRVTSEIYPQPPMQMCLDIFPLFGISSDPSEWAASWIETTGPAEEDINGNSIQPVALNIAQIVRPPKSELQ